MAEFALPLDEIVQTISGRMGLAAPSGPAQTAIYIVTFTAFKELLQLAFPAAAGVLKLDVNGFTLAKVAKQIRELDEKMDKLMGSAAKSAETHFDEALSHLAANEPRLAYDKFDTVNDKAVDGYHLVGEVSQKARCLHLTFIARLYRRMYSKSSKESTKEPLFVPYEFLRPEVRKAICDEVKRQADELLRAVAETRKKKREVFLARLGAGSRKRDKDAEATDAFLRVVFPFIYEFFQREAVSGKEGPEDILRQMSPYVPSSRENRASYPSKGILTVFKAEVKKRWVVQADLFSGKCILCDKDIICNFHTSPVEVAEGVFENYAAHSPECKLKNLTRPINSDSCQESINCKNCRLPISGVRTLRLLADVTGSNEVFHAGCAGKGSKELGSEIIVGPLRDL